MELKKHNWINFIFQWDICRIQSDKTSLGLHGEGRSQIWKRALKDDYSNRVCNVNNALNFSKNLDEGNIFNIVSAKNRSVTCTIDFW